MLLTGVFAVGLGGLEMLQWKVRFVLLTGTLALLASSLGIGRFAKHFGW
jgi:hypothetical protein